MKTTPIAPADLSASVISVPPVAWTSNGELATAQNRRIVTRLQEGGISTFLYGGNANLQNLGLAEFTKILDFMTEAAPAEAWMLPSIGPDFGKARDQVRIARNYAFPALMALPAGSATSPGGVATGLRRLSDLFGRPLVAYLRAANYVSPGDLAALLSDGAICAIKYAVEPPDPAQDSYLAAIVDAAGPERIVSGLGERPAILHMQTFGLAGFTSGAVCIAPRLSSALLRSIRGGELDGAETIRRQFLPIEDLRARISPIAVLHATLHLVDIADTGPLHPFLSNVDDSLLPEIEVVASALLRAEQVQPEADGRQHAPRQAEAVASRH